MVKKRLFGGVIDRKGSAGEEMLEVEILPERPAAIPRCADRVGIGP
jgi:hypothetical protein